MARIQTRLISFDYVEASVVEEIDRNLRVLYATPEGSCAGDRNYGLDWSMVDLPIEIAENQLSVEIVEKTEEYEPRVEVDEIVFSSDLNGHLGATVTLIPSESYIADMEEGSEEDEDEESW